MKDKWEELLTLLSNMLSIYQAILALSQQKYDILVSAKSHELEILTKQEEILTLQVGKLEDSRGKLFSELVASYGLLESEVSFAQLLTLATPNVVQKIEKFSKEFRAIKTEMMPVNKLNTELITQALSFINYNINLLSQTSVGATYADKGQTKQEVPQRAVFDARV